MGPSYACLFEGYMEHSLFQSYSGPNPQLFRQYTDDIIDEANFDKEASEMSIFSLSQGFCNTVVDRALNRVRPISSTSALTPSLPSRNSDRIPLILTDHPTSIHIQKIIRYHFCHPARCHYETYIPLSSL
eukprot:g18243.t1